MTKDTDHALQSTARAMWTMRAFAHRESRHHDAWRLHTESFVKILLM